MDIQIILSSGTDLNNVLIDGIAESKLERPPRLFMVHPSKVCMVQPNLARCYRGYLYDCIINVTFFDLTVSVSKIN
jgi:hypothetical protein